MEGGVTTLHSQMWLCGVKEARLLHILSIPHFHQALITIFVIRKLLFLVHDGYLWLEETIPIIAEHIPRISWLPCVGRDAAEILGTSGNLTIDDCRNRMQWRKKVIALPSVWGKPFA